MAEKTEAQIEAMEKEAQAWRLRQETARNKANAERLITESEANKDLRAFVNSGQYSEFYKVASAVAAAHTGMPLVQHLVGALTSLSVVSAEVTNAEQSYEAAATALAAKDGDL